MMIGSMLVSGARRAALAGDVDVEQAAARHLRARADGELADIELGPVMHAEDLLAGKFLEQPVLDHGSAPPRPSSAGWR